MPARYVRPVCPPTRQRGRTPSYHDILRVGGRLLFFYSPDMWALDVIVTVGNLKLYQTLFGISDPRWRCSTMELCGSAALELFFRAGALSNTPSVHIEF
jgi:hypothetical protein